MSLFFGKGYHAFLTFQPGSTTWVIPFIPLAEGEEGRAGKGMIQEGISAPLTPHSEKKYFKTSTLTLAPKANSSLGYSILPT